MSAACRARRTSSIMKAGRRPALTPTAFAGRGTSAVAEAVRRQADSGIDIVADGEMGKRASFPM